ncbi:MAG TPA: GNAT family N-acetyltransferase [Streptosporangiaceae bacterium]|jgi:ribosomal-protein-alanine N-acetyltransferase
MTATRLISIDDAPAITKLILASRDFLAPWEPARSESHFTVEGQRNAIGDALTRAARGIMLPHVILDEDGAVQGRVTLNNVIRGPFQSCSLGYWLGESANGRGLATRAVANMKRIAFGQLALHRIEAGTLKHNVRSQRVLDRNGFERFGLAPNYLLIAGQWQDHILFQTINDL